MGDAFQVRFSSTPEISKNACPGLAILRAEFLGYLDPITFRAECHNRADHSSLAPRPYIDNIDE